MFSWDYLVFSEQFDYLIRCICAWEIHLQMPKVPARNTVVWESRASEPLHIPALVPFSLWDLFMYQARSTLEKIFFISSSHFFPAIMEVHLLLLALSFCIRGLSFIIILVWQLNTLVSFHCPDSMSLHTAVHASLST